MNSELVENGRIIVIVAPSGAGKTSLIQRLLGDYPLIKESISFTTRRPRSHETHGKEYFFLTEQSFLEKKEQGEFLEWAKVHSNYYGTSKNFVLEQLRAGAVVLFDLDVQGADALMQFFGDQAKIIFIEPPSLMELRRRLEKRGTDSLQTIEERLKNAKREMEKKDSYQYCVKNDDFERAYQQLKWIVEQIIQGSK